MLKVIIDKKVYPNGYQALEHLRLDIPTSGLYAIIGESGSGKSTLLNCISGIDEFDGSLYYNEKPIKTKKDIEQYRKTIVSTIFQDFRLIEDLSVGDNISLASDIIGKELGNREIERLLATVGLPSEYSFKKINELSYGEMQRIGIARAIAKDAKIIVADEPTANLDSENANNIMAVLQEIAKSKLVMVVTHNTQLVERYCSGYIELSDGIVVKNTLPNCRAENDAESEPSVGKTSFSLLGKLIKSQRKNFRKNIANIIVTIVFLFLSALGLVFSQVTFEYAMKNTLNSNNKSDRTVYASFVSEDGETTISSKYLDEQIGFCNLGHNTHYPKDIFSNEEYSTYLKTIDSKQRYYGNSVISVHRAIFADSLKNMGFELICGESEIKDNEVIIPSSIADVIIALGKTTQAFTREKIISAYDDLLNCEFSIPKLLDSKVVEIVGIYQSPTKKIVSYGEYEKLKNKSDYDLMVWDILANNSVVLSKSNVQEYVDGIVLNYARDKGKCFKNATQFATKQGVDISYRFIGISGLKNSVDTIIKIKYFAIIPLTVLLNALLVLTIYIALSGTISRNKEQILTLRALGMSSSSITKIYLLSAIIMTVIEIILFIVFILAGVPLINLIIGSFYPKYAFTLLGISALSLLLPMLVIMVSSTLVIIVSIMRLFGKSVETQVKEA